MSAVAEDYRLDRAAQDHRFDTREGAGGVDHTMTGTDEYRAYFGLGEWAGSGVERRVTFKDHLVSRAAEAAAELAAAPIVDEPAPVSAGWEISADQAFYLTGADLIQLAASGDRAAVAEINRRAAKRAARRTAAKAESVSV